jgi:hypothetical protein
MDTMRATTRTTMQRLITMALLAACACSTNDSTGDGDGGVIVTDEGVCASTFDASAGKYPHSALPTGQSCTAATVCHMPIDDCASDWTESPVGPSLNEYECQCNAGVWACEIAEPVDDECNEDAGSTPSGDASDDATTEAAVPVDSSSDAPLDATLGPPVDAGLDASDAGDAGLLDAGSDAADGS